MKGKGKHKKGRVFFILLRRSPGSVLLHNVFVIQILLTGSILLPALLVLQGCSYGRQVEDTPQTAAPPVQEPPSGYSVTVKPDTESVHWKIEELTYYIYSSDGLGMLQLCTDMSAPALLPQGEYELVAIANSQGEIDTSVVSRHGIMELLTCRLDEEDPDSPMCSGELHLSVSSDTLAYVKLTPMMSRVKLVRIENNLEGRTRIEDPYVHLTQVNAQAEVLRHSGFRPSELMQAGDISYMDDIGTYPSYPDLTLYCYPNESAGEQATGIVLGCSIGGIMHKMESRLPPIGRNSTIYASLVINNAGDYRWNFNE